MGGGLGSKMLLVLVLEKVPLSSRDAMGVEFCMLEGKVVTDGVTEEEDARCKDWTLMLDPT